MAKRKLPVVVDDEPKLTTSVRSTLEPGKVLEVDSAELLELDARGLIDSRETDEDWEPAPADDEAEPDDETGGELA
jgi:hypothetical protein